MFSMTKMQRFVVNRSMKYSISLALVKLKCSWRPHRVRFSLQFWVLCAFFHVFYPWPVCLLYGDLFVFVHFFPYLL